MSDVVIWTVWWERNRCTFEDLESSVRIIEACVSFLSDWSRAWGFITVSSLGDFLEFLSTLHSTYSS
jgi:hypothetical protein